MEWLHFESSWSACFLPLSDASSFAGLYIVTSVFLSGVMVRLMLVFAPAASIMAALSGAFAVFTWSVKFQMPGLLGDSDVYHHTPSDGVKIQIETSKEHDERKTGMSTCGERGLSWALLRGERFILTISITMSANSKLSKRIFDYPSPDFLFWYMCNSSKAM